jgi:hypothetical protein
VYIVCQRLAAGNDSHSARFFLDVPICIDKPSKQTEALLD